MIGVTRDEQRRFVLEQTVLASPPLCPELRMRLVTEQCPLWRATEQDLDRLGLEPPFWAFCWAGGQALARHLLDAPELVRGRTVLDFGAGGGVEALAALRSGARSVLASDIDPLAAVAIELNAEANGVTLEVTTEDLVGRDEGWDVVLAGDVCYDRALAERVLGWLMQLARRGALVLVGDPRRGFLDTSALRLLAELEAPSDVDVDGRYLRRTGVFQVTG